MHHWSKRGMAKKHYSLTNRASKFGKLDSKGGLSPRDVPAGHSFLPPPGKNRAP
jgi:hypothetical protein